MIQVIGRNSDRETKKGIMYLKERRIEFQFVDLDKKDLAKREWEAVFSSVDSPRDLIDEESKFYKKEGYAFREYDPVEELIMHPELLKTPIFRNKNRAILGLNHDSLKEIL